MPDSIALELLKRHEGFRQKPYHCPAGKLTVGYGRNLDDRGIRREEAELMLKNDINDAVLSLQSFPFWPRLNEERRAVLIDMHVNMGNAGLLRFRKMFDALMRDDFSTAAAEMKNSIWARQVPTRAAELIHMMKTGQVRE